MAERDRGATVSVQWENTERAPLRTDGPPGSMAKSQTEPWRSCDTRDRRKLIHRATAFWPIEWPTVAIMAACYTAWAFGLTLLGSALATPPSDTASVAVSVAPELLMPFSPSTWPTWLGWIGLPLTIMAVTLHSSLQHEVLHGHPTRSAAVNEALVTPAIGVAFPYRRFRVLHLRHHNDERLTDPYDDPESWFLAERDHAALSPAVRGLLAVNATLIGRLIVGPTLSVVGTYRADVRAWRNGDRSIADAYARHGLSLLVVFSVVWWLFGISPLVYVALVAYPALSLLMLRTYAEHRAHRDPDGRTAIVEHAPIFSLLFLHNNLHVVHHANPRLAWYRLPALYAANRAQFLARNDGYRFNGYGQIFRQFAFRRAHAIVHPYARRMIGADVESAHAQRSVTNPPAPPVAQTLPDAAAAPQMAYNKPDG